MADREKVIKGLEICTKDIPMSNAVHKSDFCKECPYYSAENRYCWNQIVMMRDALALLKEQEEKLKFLDALYNYINPNDMEQYMQMYRSLPVPSDGRSVKWDG